MSKDRNLNVWLLRQEMTRLTKMKSRKAKKSLPRINSRLSNSLISWLPLSKRPELSTKMKPPPLSRSETRPSLLRKLLVCSRRRKRPPTVKRRRCVLSSDSKRRKLSDI